MREAPAAVARSSVLLNTEPDLFLRTDLRPERPVAKDVLRLPEAKMNDTLRSFLDGFMLGVLFLTIAVILAVYGVWR